MPETPAAQKSIETDRLDAFISYSRKDAAFARKLETCLEAYHPPRDLDVPQRRLVVFRDEQDITGPEYYAAVDESLQRSNRLIVVCSPVARASGFVNDEIRRFVRLHSAADVIPVLLSGVPNNEAAAGSEADKAFPEALVEALGMPLAISYVGFDVSRDRPDGSRWTNAWYTLIANLYGRSRADVEQREMRRRLRRRNVTIGVVSAAAIVLAALSGVAWMQKRVADRERLNSEQRLAENFWQRSLAAREQGDELVSAHWLAQTAALDAGAPRRPAALLGIRTALGSARLRLITDGFTEADLPEGMRLPIPPRALLSPDESVLATWMPGDGGTKGNAIARLWRTSDGTRIGGDLKHDYYIYAGRFIDGGRRLLTMGGAELLSLGDGPTQPITFWDAVSGRSKTLAMPTIKAGQIAVWNVDTGDRAVPVMELPDRFQKVVISTKANRVLALTESGLAQVWSLDDGRPLRPVMAAEPMIENARFVDDDRRVFTSLYNGPCLIWHVEAITGGGAGPPEAPEPVECPPKDAPNAPEDELSFKLDDPPVRSRDHGDRTLSFEDRTVVVERRGAFASEQVVLRHEGDVSDAVFASGGRSILTVSGNGVARLWDLVEDFPASATFRHDADLDGLAIDEPHSRVFTWASVRPSDRLEVRSWSIPTGSPLTTMTHDDPLATVSVLRESGGVVLSRDGDRVLSRALDGTVRLRAAADGRDLVPPMRHADQVLGAAFSRDERRIASWDQRARLYRWDAATGAALGPPIGLDEKWSWDINVLWSRDGARLVAWSGKSVSIWDAVAGTSPAPPLEHDELVMGVRLDARDERLLSWSRDGAIRLWDARTGAELTEPMIDVKAPPEPAAGAVFSADGARILSWTAFFSPWGRMAGNARLWNAADGTPVGARLTHKSQVHGAALFASDTRVLTWSNDAHARIWDASTGGLIADLRHRGAVNGASFSSDQRRILTWSEPGVAQVWDAVTGAPASLPMSHEDISGAAYSPDGRSIATWGKDGAVRLWDSSDGSTVGRSLDFRPSGKDSSRDVPAIENVTFLRQRDGLVAWTRQSARLWIFDVDGDFPREHIPLVVEAATGSTLDAQGRLRFLTRAEWTRKRATLQQIERDHAAECRATR